MVTAVRRLLTGHWTSWHVLASSLGSVILIRWASSWEQEYQDRVGASFDATGHIWRWFVAAALLVAAGVLIGLAVRRRGFGGRFDWTTTLALGLVPLGLAMTFPAFIWSWPWAASSASPFWSFRVEFMSFGLAATMWVLVGVAIAAGWRSRSG